MFIRTSVSETILIRDDILLPSGVINDDDSYENHRSSKPKLHLKKIKYGEKRFYGGWNSYTLQCGMIITLISPGDGILQCGMLHWNRDSEFTKWQHPAM